MFSVQDHKPYQCKQTTALRQPQMKANLYAINRGRSSFNLRVRPACCCCCCSTPPCSFTAVLCLFCPLLFLPFLACVLTISVLTVLLGRAQRQGKLTDASIIHRSPPLSLCLSLVFSPPSPSATLPPLCKALCIHRHSECLQGGEWRVGTNDVPMDGYKDGRMDCVDDGWINGGVQCWSDWQGREVAAMGDGSWTGICIRSVPFSRLGSHYL